MCEVSNCYKKVIAKNKCQFHYDRLRRYGDTYTRPEVMECVDCKIIFNIRKTGNLPTRCDDCQTVFHRNQMRADRRRKGLWEGYKLTLAEYQNMHDAQNGVCAICGGTQTGRGAKNNQLSVDHDHKTGKVRALLCTHCNTAIGHFRENTELLKEAINYLERYTNA